jgi:aconitase A
MNRSPTIPDHFGTADTLTVGGRTLTYHRLDRSGAADLARLPMTVKILLEQLLRAPESNDATTAAVGALARYPSPVERVSIPFRPTRILLQDYTGVPAAVDLAAMRSAVQRAGGDPALVEPQIPVDLVIDHSVQADFFGAQGVAQRNLERDYQRNRERYALLRWAGQAFETFQVVPPGAGICHQVNLERLARVVQERDGVAMPDTLFGADSHTTMVNGLGVLGWGVGGIEAEAAMLGQPTYLPYPVVVGVRLTGELPTGTTATDLVLTLTERLRRHGVVNKFVEFCGDGLARLSVQDRATASNMCPEYGATAAYFPIDGQTLRYLTATGRGDVVELVETYARAQALFREDGAPLPQFDELIELDLAGVRPSIAGPKRPQDRVELAQVWQSFVGPQPTKGVTVPGETEGPKPLNDAFQTDVAEATAATATVAHRAPGEGGVTNGSIVLAAITSCTNTSNPSVMIGAGLLAKKAVERGLSVKPYVKTTLSPGSRVVMRYLDAAGLTPYLQQLGFYFTGVGCFTCIARGTPVLQANGTARPIEHLPEAGGAVVFGPDHVGRLAVARQEAARPMGLRECVQLTLQDGRTLICTPDHELLTADGRWVGAAALDVGKDRLVIGFEAPLDQPLPDEFGYELAVGNLRFSFATPAERIRTLAFGRLLGHLLDDGSISVLGQGRLNVGQAVDREIALNDIEIITGKRPKGSRYDDRKWSIALPMNLTAAITQLAGVRVGRRVDQAPSLPEFILDPRCPVSLVREFLAGMFGADGHAPTLARGALPNGEGSLRPPSYSHAVRPEHVEQQKAVMLQMVELLGRCGVVVNGASIYTYPVRRSATTYPAAGDGPRIEVRLTLSHGLSFVTRVGYRYCIDKALKATAAAAYWRMVDTIGAQRDWMMGRLARLHADSPELTFAGVRRIAADELERREAIAFEHYSTLQGNTHFSRLTPPTSGFRPLHRRSAGFPSTTEFLSEIGARSFFSELMPGRDGSNAKRYAVEKESMSLPTLSLRLIDRRPAGMHEVFDASVDEVNSFVAGGVAVHNCIGNSGPLATPEIEQEVKDRDLNVVSVLSGNRNFEGRIHPLVKSSYLASPPLVVAFALAGTVHIDLHDQPLGNGADGRPVFLADIWPTQDEIAAVMERAINEDMYTDEYAKILEGDALWQTMPAPAGPIYEWDPASTYIQEPPFFRDLSEVHDVADIKAARVLVMVGDSVTTDHISPAGSIAGASPAGEYLIAHGVAPADFNQYGTRRGNHEVMVRGTFANIRLRNQLAGREGWWTRHLPSGEEMSIFEASARYQADGIPLLVLAGKEYGSGSSRDWAAKGPLLLGVRAVIAESFERIHRSNLVGMGILPLQYQPGESAASLGLTGEETFSIGGLDRLAPRAVVQVEARRADGGVVGFECLARVDDPIDLDYLRHGGVLPMVLRQLMA